MANYNAVDADILLASGASLDPVIQSILSSIFSLNEKSKLVIIEDLKDIGVDLEKDSLVDIASYMPRGAVVSFHVSFQAAYAPLLPMPTLSNGANKTYFSGRIFGYRNPADFNKAAFLFIGNSGLLSWTSVQLDSENKFMGWKFPSNAGVIANPSARDFDKKMANIFVPCDYYFSSDKVREFTDAPPNAGAGYVTVTSQSGMDTDNRLITFTENGVGARAWKMINYIGKWVSIPSMNNEPVRDEDLRIGDMKLTSSGNLAIRTNSTTVKSL
ncbi:hypothetical protein [Providencia rettgeri]|uniref:hypothetical protein n=1 Tax=Providencia rettgeri TaxID=587 RepID=UPI00065DDBCE|nr:hypothetical protein [Providencia rettgeri]